MRNLRKYGSPPFSVAVIHGGPGAPGEMAPVARELSSTCGVLEPLQTAASLDGQVRELRDVLEEKGDSPVTLIGWSWGAWLSIILTAGYPALVKRLILIGSGPLEAKYAGRITETRLARLGKEERAEVLTLMEALGDTAGGGSTEMSRLGELISRADSYDPLPYENKMLQCQPDVFQGVWRQAAELRNSGGLLELGKKIECPVVAIHGEYDPHPFEGVEVPLSHVLSDFRFILLEKCGHQPWIERAARDEFYRLLRDELP
ncbi:MAG: alpha/beta hydrolase [Actinobacteria bacterium]|nr:alpha/beta hydrolase [Actinomycetota bacterium]MCG2818587.1 alpha/beta hydrolase [Actinomycetes bacterium]MBU4178583.1 alpha/beta hydrolase [Actinomycetota bacterium]MBU4218224.1 alpha/beta hydrolase [Actinomycetota bacterium]MBU4358649.1 alpha/beta hydrolase [Actinomycetota bacterium]